MFTCVGSDWGHIADGQDWSAALSVDDFGVCFLVRSYVFSKTWTATGVRRDLRC